MKFHFPWQSSRKPSIRITEQISYTAHPLAAGSILGGYKVERLISKTRCGYTYSANNNGVLIQEYFPRDIAIRDTDHVSVLLHDEAANSTYEHGLSRFLLLARILSQIDHPGRVVHYQEQYDTAWYAINFESRASLGDLLGAGKRLPQDALEAILGAALVYLDAAHQSEIFHLELSPEQLLLSGEEEVLVCGFNVARLIGSSLKEKEVAYYCAPEHLHTAGRLGAWSDFYSLGAMMLQGISPSIPPTAARRMETLQVGKADPLVPATKLGRGYYSNEFLELVDWMLEMSTGDRPSSVEHLFRKMDPDGPIAQKTKAINLVSYGPAFATQNPQDDLRRIDTNRSANEDETNGGTVSSPHNSNYLSGTAPAGAARLAVAALNAASGEPTSHEKVADALEQTAKILEPADIHHRWVAPLVGNQEDSRLLSIRGRQSTDTISETPEDAKGWRSHLRIGVLFLNTRKPAQRSNEGLAPRIPLRATRVHNPLLWLSLSGVVAIAGIWIWLQAESTKIEEPTRIEVLGSTNNGATEAPNNIQNTVDLTSIVSISNSPTDSNTTVDSLLINARKYQQEGIWFGNTGYNAYAAYQKALLLAPTNNAAKTGIEELIKQSLGQITIYLDRSQIEVARSLIVALNERNLAVEKLPALEKRLRDTEDRRRQDELTEALVLEQRKKEQRIRREKINNLLNRASNAFENGNLIQPQGENALTLYKAALDLDRNNQRARNGINSIGDHFLQQARIALATSDLNRAQQDLQRAATVRKNDPTIRYLQEQLTQRRDLMKRKQKIQAELIAKQLEAKRLVVEQAKINLKSGIEAYYRGNYFEAYSFLYPLAEDDIARAQVRVATMLLQGRGISPNKESAKKWFLKALSQVQLAAARGEAWAQSDYGDYFADGVVIQQDFRNAIIWYRRSAKQGYSPAQSNLGLMHMHGSGVKPDWNEAIEWFRMAAAQGNYAAQENLRLLDIQPDSTGS